MVACLVFIMGLLIQVGTDVPESPLTVAGAIKDSAKYDGKRVAIAAPLFLSIHGIFAEGEGCNKRVNALKREFACAVLIALPECRRPDTTCTQGLISLSNVIRERVEASLRLAPIPVLLTGKLEVAPRRFVERPLAPDIPGVPKGDYIQMGFGHMNAFDVRLIVTDARLLSDEELARFRSSK